MYNRCKILLIFTLSCILSVFAGKGVHNICCPENVALETSVVIGQSSNIGCSTATQYNIISDFNDYISNLFRTSSYKLPSSVNFITERTPFQYLRVRKAADNGYYNFKYKVGNSISINNIFCFNEVHAGLKYTCAREYFIYTLNRIRI